MRNTSLRDGINTPHSYIILLFINYPLDAVGNCQSNYDDMMGKEYLINC